MAVSETMVQMALAVIRGDETAALQLADQIQERFSKGEVRIPPVVDLTNDRRSLRCVIFLPADMSFDEADRVHLNAAYAEWVHGQELMVLPTGSRVEFYRLRDPRAEFPEGMMTFPKGASLSAEDVARISEQYAAGLYDPVYPPPPPVFSAREAREMWRERLRGVNVVETPAPTPPFSATPEEYAASRPFDVNEWVVVEVSDEPSAPHAGRVMVDPGPAADGERLIYLLGPGRSEWQIRAKYLRRPSEEETHALGGAGAETIPPPWEG